jgi:carbonic anhydrase
MSQTLYEVLTANREYARGFSHEAQLPITPARKFAILTCMDARLDPAKFAGLKEGDAHVIRNAGGRASDDAIRSLVVSHKLLGTREWFVIHHTDCGMSTITGPLMARLLSHSLETALLTEQGWKDVGLTPGSDAGERIDWMTFKDTTLSVVTDVWRIRNHPLVPPWVSIYGYVYDVRTGRLKPVRQAISPGSPQGRRTETPDGQIQKHAA